MSELVKAKKNLGQHFLNDKNIAFNIVDALLSKSNVNDVLEVGPGMGVLTKFLLEAEPKRAIWAAEIDNESIEYLHKNYPQLQEKLLAKSFLDINFEDYFQNELVVIGNFPYNISSQIVFKIIDNKVKIPMMVGMFQKEVAERLSAKPGGKEYGIISVITQAYFEVDYLFTVHEDVFTPPPKVKSGVIRMTRKVGVPDCNQSLFKTVVKTAFNQRRKKLRNAISSFGINDEQLGLFASKRAEELSLLDFVELTNLVEEKGQWKKDK
ncbi:MAG: 16S rRNA (adenine(1518)-N(6)/adenine(1519)-N(6))-dimethyltransferase RsmA [Bacteroidia bacterium]